MNLLERIERHFEWMSELTAQDLAWHQEYGNLMRAQRISAGMSIRSMATLLEIAPSALCDYENGHRPWNVQTAKVYLEIVALKLSYGVPQVT